jgi:CMP-2-keto-3-deoxyoctulosonic acid synthetase
MKFIKYQPRFTKSRLSIYVNKNNVNISSKVYKMLGEPELIDFYYDKENKVIKIVPNDQGQKVTFARNRTAPHLGCKLSRVMPIGIYKYTENNIFVFDS